MIVSARLRILLLLIGLALAVLSLALLAYALLPGDVPLRLQATLAPGLFGLPPGAP